MIVAGASAYARLIDYRLLADIARSVSACLLVDMAHIAGLVAAGVIPSPVPVSDFVTFTTYKTLMGGRGGVIICKEKYRRQIDRAVFPGSQGTPALNQVAAKAVCFHLAATREFAAVQKRVVANAAAMADEFNKNGLSPRFRRYGQSSGSGGSAAQRIDRPGRRRSARINRYHRQPQCDPQRPAAARSSQWHPGRRRGHQCQGT